MCVCVWDLYEAWYQHCLLQPQQQALLWKQESGSISFSTLCPARGTVCVFVCQCPIGFWRQTRTKHPCLAAHLSDKLAEIPHSHTHSHTKIGVTTRRSLGHDHTHTFMCCSACDVHICVVYMDLVFEPMTSAVLVPCSWTEPAQMKVIQPPKLVVMTKHCVKVNQKFEIVSEPRSHRAPGGVVKQISNGDPWFTGKMLPLSDDVSLLTLLLTWCSWIPLFYSKCVEWIPTAV